MEKIGLIVFVVLSAALFIWRLDTSFNLDIANKIVKDLKADVSRLHKSLSLKNWSISHMRSAIKDLKQERDIWVGKLQDQRDVNGALEGAIKKLNIQVECLQGRVRDHIDQTHLNSAMRKTIDRLKLEIVQLTTETDRLNHLLSPESSRVFINITGFYDDTAHFIFREGRGSRVTHSGEWEHTYLDLKGALEFVAWGYWREVTGEERTQPCSEDSRQTAKTARSSRKKNRKTTG